MAIRRAPGRSTRLNSVITPYNGGGGGGRLYVGNLAYEVTWRELKDHFKQAGHVIRADVVEDPNGRSKGYGLVEFATAREARAAIDRLNDTEILGRQIFVREDREAGHASAPSNGPSGGRFVHQGPPAHARSVVHGGGGGGGGRRLYVGNLSWDVKWHDLKDFCKTVGNVIRADVMEEHNGRSKGCGIVEYSTVEEAQRAIAELNDQELKGRLVFIREDREEKGVGFTGGVASGGGRGHAVVHSSGPRGGHSGGHGGSTGGRRVYVGNLSWDVKWHDLKDFCKTVGNVIRADVMEEHNGRSKGCGIVEYSTAEEAQRAIAELNDRDLKGRMVFVREDREDH